jgi:hypothetical protein
MSYPNYPFPTITCTSCGGLGYYEVPPLFYREGQAWETKECRRCLGHKVLTADGRAPGPSVRKLIARNTPWRPSGCLIFIVAVFAVMCGSGLYMEWKQNPAALICHLENHHNCPGDTPTPTPAPAHTGKPTGKR